VPAGMHMVSSTRRESLVGSVEGRGGDLCLLQSFRLRLDRVCERSEVERDNWGRG